MRNENELVQNTFKRPVSQIDSGNVDITTVVPKENIQRVMDYNQYELAKSKLAENENISMALSQAFKNTFTKASKNIRENIYKKIGKNVSYDDKNKANVVSEQILVQKSDSPIKIESSR